MRRRSTHEPTLAELEAAERRRRALFVVIALEIFAAVWIAVINWWPL